MDNMSNKQNFTEVNIFADHPEMTMPKQKHKKHKKHKKKQRQHHDYETETDTNELAVIDVVSDTPPESDLLIKMETQPDLSAAEKLKSQQFTPKLTLTLNNANNTATIVANKSSSSATTSATTTKKKKNLKAAKDSGTSSEEERWLDAIESGKLEQVDDELKKIKDPKLMTARQRAMYERGSDKDSSSFPGGEILLALPSGYKEKVMTAEAIQKAQIKSQKRKQLADEKREKDKKKTMERLLKKQDSKSGKNMKNRPAKTIIVPVITYRNTINGATITFPPSMPFPIKAKKNAAAAGEQGAALPKIQLCAMCGDTKRYNCSKTNIPLCSFRCYKKNVASLKEIMC